MAAWSDGTRVQKIADIDYPAYPGAFDAIFFDAESSLVLYSDPGEAFSGALVAFDLKTGQARTLALPYGFGLRLLDRANNGILAYSVSGPFVPDDSFEPTAMQWLVEGVRPAGVNVPHVCFVKFP